MNFGAITPNDAALLEIVLGTYRGGSLKFLEIGTHEGNTARGVRDWCRQNRTDLTYKGIDAHYLGAPFPEAQQIVGRSEEVFNMVCDEQDIIFVDGCHCLNHVILDAVHYAPLARLGGYMLFHDTDPQVQRVQKNHWVHGSEDKPIYRTQVVAALAKLGWPNDKWVLSFTATDPLSDIGGMMAFRRMK